MGRQLAACDADHNTFRYRADRPDSVSEEARETPHCGILNMEKARCSDPQIDNCKGVEEEQHNKSLELTP